MNLDDYIRNIPDYPKKGVQFKDISPLLSNPSAYSHSIDLLRQQYNMDEVDVIAGFDARGFLFAAPLALAEGKPFVPLRKKGKLPYESISEEYGLEYGNDELEVHVDAFNRGDKVLLVDDLLATGGSMFAGAKLVERLGGEVVGCEALIELGYLNGREVLKNYEVKSILKY